MNFEEVLIWLCFEIDKFNFEKEEEKIRELQNKK